MKEVGLSGMANRSVLQVLLALALALAILAVGCSAAVQQPIVFVLGDSTADVGTNSFLQGSRFRADFPPNGVDFPGSRPTGRFSNGLNSADFLATFLGFKRSPPPFLSLNSSFSLLKYSFHGINFASGGCGLLDLTGQPKLSSTKPVIRNVMTLTQQIEQFSVVHDTIRSAIGPAATCKLLEKSLFFISIGSNDIFGYYHSNSSVSKQDFIQSLKCSYENHLKQLYALGARKFGIISVPPIGCCPSQRIYNETGGCIDELNELALAFHSSVTAMLKKLSSEYDGFIYSLGNAYDMTMDVILNPRPFKFMEVETACCGTGRFNGEGICDPEANLCSQHDRSHYLLWDLFHPTQAASKLAALTLFAGGPRYVSPINFAQLARA